MINPSVTRSSWLLRLSLSLLALLLACGARAAVSDFHCTPPQLWQSDFGAPPRTPFVGDADADGYDDLLCLWPEEGCIVDVSINANGEKAIWQEQARRDFGRDGLSAACGRFTDDKGVGVLAVMGDRSIRLAHQFDPKTIAYLKDDVLGKLPEPVRKPAKMVAGDVDGDDYAEGLVVTADGAVHLIDVNAQEPARSSIKRIGRIAAGIKAITLGDFSGTGTLDLVYLDRKGQVLRCSMSSDALGRPHRIAKSKDGSELVAAHLDDDDRADLVVGTMVMWGGNPTNTSEWPELAASRPGLLAAGHIRGDKRDDLIRFQRTSDQYQANEWGTEPYSRYDTFVHFTYKEGDPDPTNCGLTLEEKKKLGLDPMKRDTSGDGLLDGWKAKGVRGIDLPALGVNPLKKNIICEITPIDFPDSELPKLREECDAIHNYYACLPTSNPDGSRGINILFIILKTQPKDVNKRSWGENGEEFHDKTHRGITHWMQVTYNAGGGQSSQMNDRGSCGYGGFYAVFIHEFGHQLGLDHSGFWSNWGPTYKSLMNYTYSYANPLLYSNGKFRDVVLRQNDLSEVLPYRLKYVNFLGGGPYHFKLKEDGLNTLIDWNRNGVFGEEHVRGRISDGYSIDWGNTTEAGTTMVAPLVVSCQKDLLLFYGAEKETAADGKKPVALMMKQNKGHETFGDAVEVDTGLTGDPRAAVDDKTVWLFYPTQNGTLYRELNRSGNRWQWGEAKLLPGSAGKQVDACFFHGKLYVFIWSDAKTPVEFSVMSESGWSEPKSLGVLSNVPVAAGVDSIKDQILLATAQDQEKRTNRWQIRYFAKEADGSLVEKQMRWTMGEKGWARGDTQPNIIFETGKDAGPEGRIHLVFGGARDGNTIAGIWLVEEIADKTIDDGWVLKRYGNEWVNSLNGPTATWFENDIVIAYRWYGETGWNHDNDLHVNWHGLGVNDLPLGDFDDISFIDKIGVQHSILRAGTKQ